MATMAFASSAAAAWTRASRSVADTGRLDRRLRTAALLEYGHLLQERHGIPTDRREVPLRERVTDALLKLRLADPRPRDTDALRNVGLAKAETGPFTREASTGDTRLHGWNYHAVPWRDSA